MSVNTQLKYKLCAPMYEDFGETQRLVPRTFNTKASIHQFRLSYPHKSSLLTPAAISSPANIHNLNFAENFSSSGEVLNALSSANLHVYEDINTCSSAHDGVMPFE